MADFYKYHALGNDYIVIDPNKCEVKLDEENIKLICNRHLGVGSDGILYGPFFNQEQLSFKIFNPDGSEAEKSGNGIRIFAQYLIDEGYEKDNTFDLYTQGGKVEIEIIDSKNNLIKVNMGTFSFENTKIPMSGKKRKVIDEEINILDKQFKITCLSIGNPHCVIIADQPSKELAEKYGPSIENYPDFLNKTNVQFVKILDPENIRIEIWERGAGYTLASGSSSCAAASAVHQLGLSNSSVTVHMPGGKVKVQITDDQHAYLTGHVSARIAEGFFKQLS